MAKKSSGKVKVKRSTGKSNKSNNKFYVTTAIDYVNAEPHVGHAYQKIIADIFARWNRIGGKDVWFLTGTDEHGHKLFKNAREKGKDPKEFVDEMSKKFKEAWKVLNIDYNRFIRTTDKDHEEFVKEFTKKVWESGDIYKGKYEGYYCVDCEAFYPIKDLLEGSLCPVHKRKADFVAEDTYYFKLSKYQKKLLDHYKKNPDFIMPESRKNEMINRVKEGLQDLSITRTNFSWGIPFPYEKGHVIYVWFEALQNYLSGAGEKQEYWPANMHLLGKDNGWFHAVIWPAMLMSAGYKLPKTVFVHGFLTVNGEKISKSLGNVISPNYLVQKYGSDAVRYLIVRQIPFSNGNDGDFSEKELIERYNGELANKLGNLVSRVNGLISKAGGELNSSETDEELASKLDLKSIKKHMGNYEIEKALSLIFAYIDECNNYIQSKQPWKLQGEEFAKIMYSVADSIRIISILLWPFIPSTSEKINAQFGFDKPNIENCKFGLAKKVKVKKADLLFKKIE